MSTNADIETSEIENKVLRRKLKQANETIALIKSGHIDALVGSNKNDLQVFTEKTADKTYRILVEKMHEGAVTINKEGTILYCNSCFAGMVNLPLQKVIGAPLKSYIDEMSMQRFELLLQNSWENYQKDEVYLKGNNSNVIPVLMSVNNFLLESETVLSIILTDLRIRNQNRQKLKLKTKQVKEKINELESTNMELAFQIDEKEKRTTELGIAQTDVKELEGLNTHKEQVLATLSHDLRSPLAGIIQGAEFLKDSFDKLDESTIKELLDHLHKASINELNMLDYLVEWARIKYASEAFVPSNIELDQYVNTVFETLSKNASANKIQLRNEVEKSTVVFADKKMLLSILQNIISNSIKHTRKNGTVTVTSTKKDNKIVVQIKDTGVGMSKEVMAKLFTPQLKSLSAAREENKGAGIGLLLVKGFLEKNGGEIWIESVVGKGSSFYFTIPANQLTDNTNASKE